MMMSETKHTPGPWHWINSATDKPFDFDAEWDGDGLPSLRTVEEYVGERWSLPKWILDTGEPMQNGNDAANACLIAAAPDLLEILTYVRDNAQSDLPEMWARVDAIIAKATGAQP
jgi:hypothetical protein